MLTSVSFVFYVHISTHYLLFSNLYYINKHMWRLRGHSLGLHISPFVDCAKFKRV